MGGMNANRFEIRVAYETNRAGVVSHADSLDAAKAHAAKAWTKKAPRRAELLGATILDRATGTAIRAAGESTTPAWW